MIEARRGIGGWLCFYNEKRPHQALGYRTPRAVFAGAACEQVDNPSASLRGAPALPTCSQLQHQEKESIDVLLSIERVCTNPFDVPRIGRGTGNTAGLSLGHPDSCPTDGVHLSP